MIELTLTKGIALEGSVSFTNNESKRFFGR